MRHCVSTACGNALRWFHGGDAKEKSVFASEKEAYEFVQSLYKKSGGVTPELRLAYEFYQKNCDDGHRLCTSVRMDDIVTNRRV